MTNSQRVEQIQRAIELIQEAQDLVDEAVNDTRSESHYQAYNKYGFNQVLGNGNPYDSSLYNLIDELKEEEEINKY